jgi:ABC-type proline/glycine betaine transport system permease subunit
MCADDAFAGAVWAAAAGAVAGGNAARLAILALTGYALLPILRNTYAGIGSVDRLHF